jgi:nucleotide-binding universal stress UspA family protein
VIQVLFLSIVLFVRKFDIFPNGWPYIERMGYMYNKVKSNLQSLPTIEKGVESIMKKIMVAIDGSEMTKKVLLRTRLIAEKVGGDVMVMTVVKQLQLFDYYTGTDLNEQLNEEVKVSAERTLEQARQFFEGFSGHFDTMLTFGDPAEEILQVTEREKPDLLVMGSRGLSGFERAMLGSVSLKVLHHVKCDMMIVHNE